MIEVFMSSQEVPKFMGNGKPLTIGVLATIYTDRTNIIINDQNPRYRFITEIIGYYLKPKHLCNSVHVYRRFGDAYHIQDVMSLLSHIL